MESHEQREFEESELNMYDQYIVAQVKRYLESRRYQARREEEHVERDELTQQVRIKFWDALKKRSIHSPQAYIKKIVRSEYVDRMRSQKTHQPLPADEGEFWQQEKTLAKAQREDPSNVVEEQIEATLSLQEAIEQIVQLPPRQKLAVICRMVEHVDDTVQLEEMLRKYNVDIEIVQCPIEKAEKQLLQASLSIARRTLAKNLKKKT